MALDIPGILTELAARHNKTFMYRGAPLPLEKVFAYDGALYIFVHRANLLSDFLFGESLQTSTVDAPNALSGEKVVVSPNQSSFELLMLLYDVLEELVVTSGGNEIVLA
ncbi:MAG: hypothetical protein K0R66_1226 [Gammaproteobacteria bacterium]|jgi:hypothetical protein|nr:hypothetical protein [Gammaproteobacteria bacterium]